MILIEYMFYFQPGRGCLGRYSPDCQRNFEMKSVVEKKNRP